MTLNANDRAWLEGLFDTYYDRVYAFLYARCGNKSTAEDLASQTFVKIAEKLRSYNSEKGAVSTWIFTIALNEMRSHYRRQRETVGLDDISELATPDGTESEFMQNETKDELLSILSQLDERSRGVITLKYYGYLPNREIGNLLGLSESNVGTILSRAIQKLKIILKPCDETAVYAYKSQEGKR